MNVVVTAVVAFVLSVAAGMGVRLALSVPEAPDRVAAASVEGVHREQLPMASPPAEADHARSSGVPGRIEESQPVAAPLAHVGRAPDPEPGGTGETGSGESMQFNELARILVHMDPGEAAILLSHLEEHHCLVILRSMRVRDCGAILRRLPKQRASVLRERLFESAQEETR